MKGNFRWIRVCDDGDGCVERCCELRESNLTARPYTPTKGGKGSCRVSDTADPLTFLVRLITLLQLD